jgi:hypothetical protein
MITKKMLFVKFETGELTKYPAEILIPDYVYGNSFGVYSTKEVFF